MGLLEVRAALGRAPRRARAPAPRRSVGRSGAGQDLPHGTRFPGEQGVTTLAQGVHERCRVERHPQAEDGTREPPPPGVLRAPRPGCRTQPGWTPHPATRRAGRRGPTRARGRGSAGASCPGGGSTTCSPRARRSARTRSGAGTLPMRAACERVAMRATVRRRIGFCEPLELGREADQDILQLGVGVEKRSDLGVTVDLHGHSPDVSASRRRWPSSWRMAVTSWVISRHPR